MNPPSDGADRVARAADDLEEANRELLQFLDGLARERWEAGATPEGWSVLAAAYHVADGYRIHLRWLDLLREGEPVPGTPRDLDAENAQTVADAGELTPEDVVAAARTAGRLLVAYVRGVGAAELSASAVHGPLGRADVSVEDVLEIAAWHVRHHLRGMRATIGLG